MTDANDDGPLVVKVGGSAGIDLDAVCDDLAELWHAGTRVVLVHGGSAETNRVAEALGTPPRFVTSPSGFTSRHTDRATLEVFEMVYCGSVNKGLVERLQRRGVNALGMSGLDGRLWEGQRKASLRVVEDGRVRVLRDSWTGTVERVDAGLLEALLARGRMPVLTPPGCSVDGEAINVDGDRAAAATAAALGADTLLLLSNVPGLLAEFPDEGSLVRHVAAPELDAAMELAQGRMRIKLLGAREALAGGVRRVVLGDARGAGCVRRALAAQARASRVPA
ncbi:MAG: [LysW]-aminoadipate kinase [Planctomycetes bacterium]|nr:[LysW]-aminoadipate kinase [Planctomycetota bacterium]